MSIHFLFLFKFIHSLTVLTLNVPNIDSSQPFYPFPIQIEYNIIILTTKGHYLLKQDDNSNYSLQALSLGNSFTPDQTSLSLGVVLLNEYVEDSISYMLFMNNKMIIVTSKEGEELSNIQHLIGNVSTKSKVSGTIKSFSYAHFSFIQEGTYFYEFLFIGSNNSIYSIIESTKTLPQDGLFTCNIFYDNYYCLYANDTNTVVQLSIDLINNATTILHNFYTLPENNDNIIRAFSFISYMAATLYGVAYLKPIDLLYVVSGVYETETNEMILYKQAPTTIINKSTQDMSIILISDYVIVSGFNGETTVC